MTIHFICVYDWLAVLEWTICCVKSHKKPPSVLTCLCCFLSSWLCGMMKEDSGLDHLAIACQQTSIIAERPGPSSQLVPAMMLPGCPQKMFKLISPTLELMSSAPAHRTPEATNSGAAPMWPVLMSPRLLLLCGQSRPAPQKSSWPAALSYLSQKRSRQLKPFVVPGYGTWIYSWF